MYGYYGDTGPTVGNSHGIFLLTGSLSFNIFNGGRIRSEIDQAAARKQRADELADLGGQIEFQVRTDSSTRKPEQVCPPELTRATNVSNPKILV